MRTLLSSIVLLVAIGCQKGGAGSEAPPTPTQPVVPFSAEGELAFLRGQEPIATIAIEIADDDSTRTRGLMQRPTMDDGTGMLFIFPTSDYQSFWMANTQMSLDMMFVDSDSTIVEIHKYTRPLSAENIGGSRLSRFVVEVPAGYTDTHGIVEGDRIRW